MFHDGEITEISYISYFLIMTASVLFELRATGHAVKYHARGKIRFVSGGKCMHSEGYEKIQTAVFLWLCQCSGLGSG